MKGSLLLTAVLTGTVLGVSGPANATVYSLADEYWLKAGTAFSTVFPGATGTAPAQGVYQQVSTSGSPLIVQLNTTTAIVTGTTNRFYNAPLPGEFTPDDTSSGIILNGWQSNVFKTAGSSAGGGPVSSFHINNGGTGANGAETGALNVVNPGLNGTGLNFQYVTGVTGNNLSTGTTALFTLNSMQIDSNATAVGFIIEGLRNGVVVDTATVSYNFVGGFVTFAPTGWTNIDEVVLTDGNWQPGTISIRNIDLTPSVAAPEPMTLSILGISLFGLGVIRHRRAG